ncbi:MAG: hypothetical protein C5B59_12360 [Bacteroidetes bacterium]|nr:MAG: hypothetical protein C5B59_12360 [Bacteroidota bacterium]
MSKYRDSETGRFVSEETFNRSTSHGGTRYYEVPEAAPPKPPEDVPEEFLEYEDLYFDGYEADEETEY